jgi:hypothetical protein
MTENQVRLDAAPPLPSPIDTSVVRNKIDDARARNRVIEEHQRKKAEHADLVARADGAEHAASELTLTMDKREVEKREAIAAAKLPIDGISFGENEILLHGVPWAQASDAERLVASMQMAMAVNPTLRIVRVRDGSLLDDDSMKLVAEMAAKQDYQVWIERVDSSGQVGVVIENGRVKSSS